MFNIKSETATSHKTSSRTKKGVLLISYIFHMHVHILNALKMFRSTKLKKKTQMKRVMITRCHVLFPHWKTVEFSKDWNHKNYKIMQEHCLTYRQPTASNYFNLFFPSILSFSYAKQKINPKNISCLFSQQQHTHLESSTGVWEKKCENKLNKKNTTIETKDDFLT